MIKLLYKTSEIALKSDFKKRFGCFKRYKSVVTIVEVGPRDGLQYEKVFIPFDVKVELINRLSNCGLKRIESGSFVNPKLVPQFSDTAQVINAVNRKVGVKYSVLVPNVKGMTRALDTKVDEIAVFGAASEQFSKKNINCSIEESFLRFKDVINMAKEHNIPIRGYLSCIVGCPYSGKVDPKFVSELALKMIEMGCFEVSLGDTIGVGTPESLSAVLDDCIKSCSANKLAIHCHDSNGMAIANISQAIDMGIGVVDASIAGLGGCPFAGPTVSGNVATEAVVNLLHRRNVLSEDINRDEIEQTAKWIRQVITQLETQP